MIIYFKINQIMIFWYQNVFIFIYLVKLEIWNSNINSFWDGVSRGCIHSLSLYCFGGNTKTSFGNPKPYFPQVHMKDHGAIIHWLAGSDVFISKKKAGSDVWEMSVASQNKLATL